jgi:PucR C-terminal helix-turn-helix domain/GGDEF-like domain
VAEASADAGNAAALLPAAAELWSIMDELSGAVTDAYRDTVAERTRSNAQTRNAMLDVLLRGDSGDGSRLWESAAMLRLPHHGTFMVVVATAPRPGVEAVPRAEEALRIRGIQSAWRVEIDAHVGVVVLTRKAGIDKLCAHLAELATGPVGVSEPYEHLDQTPAALRHARLACVAATGTELIRYEREPVAVLLAGTPDMAATVAQAVLGPVLALPAPECDTLLGTLRTWFAEDGATSTAAEKMHVHRNTVRYRLRRVEELTGRSLSRPTGVAELHLALEAARIFRLPDDGR